EKALVSANVRRVDKRVGKPDRGTGKCCPVLCLPGLLRHDRRKLDLLHRCERRSPGAVQPLDVAVAVRQKAAVSLVKRIRALRRTPRHTGGGHSGPLDLAWIPENDAGP